MQIAVPDPIFQTYLFGIIFLSCLLFSFSRRGPASVLDLDTTQELKGFAILAILFSHVGYFLASDHRFLFPFSIMAGVGVDIFLFVSGYGLTVSALKKSLSPRAFYERRLKKIFIPLWITLIGFFLLDFTFLKKVYPFHDVLFSFFGYFHHADLYNDVNSPLWFISLILFYYILFPLIFSKRATPFSALILFGLTTVISIWNPAALAGMMSLYNLHVIAFPLGMCAAWILEKKNVTPKRCSLLANSVSLGFTLFAIGYLAIHSNVGSAWWLEEGTSVLIAFLIIFVFSIKRFSVGSLYLVGMLSFEFYLLHWPILYRYGGLFMIAPAWLALSAYILILLGIARCIQNLTRRILHENAVAQ